MTAPPPGALSSERSSWRPRGTVASGFSPARPTRRREGRVTTAAARDPSFGLFLVPNAADYPDLLRQVAACERGGLDMIGIQDHPYQRRYLDTFALIGDLLARTKRVCIFPDVANLPLRPP